MSPGSSKMLAVNAGGLLQLASYQQNWSKSNKQTAVVPQSEAMTKLCEAFADTNVQLVTMENPNRLPVRLAIDNLPPLAQVLPLVMQLQNEQKPSGKPKSQASKPAQDDKSSGPASKEQSK